MAAQTPSIFDRFGMDNDFDISEESEIDVLPDEVDLIPSQEGLLPHQLSISQMYEKQRRTLQTILESAPPWAMTRTRWK